VAKKNIKLLFLDNISALTPGIEENDSSAWDMIALWTNKIKQTGCAVVFVHHAGKSGQQRGTSAREDALDTVIMLKRTVNDSMVGVDVDLVFEKSRHITGSSVTYAGGGGGHSQTTGGSGGAGGGGAGGVGAGGGTNGSSNTGGGGGGAGGSVSGSGGSGVVVIKIPSTKSATFSAGVTQSSATAGGFTVYTVTATSTTSETVTFS
jgi:hypothetical protein